MHDCRLAGMVVMLLHVVHRIVCRGSHLVHSHNGAVTDGAAIVPRHARADGDRLEGSSGRWHASMLRLFERNIAEVGLAIGAYASPRRSLLYPDFDVCRK